MGTAFAAGPDFSKITKPTISPNEITRDTVVTVKMTSTYKNINNISLQFGILTPTGGRDFYVTLKNSGSNAITYSGTGKIPSDIIGGTWKLNEMIIYFNDKTKIRFAYDALSGAGMVTNFNSTSQIYEELIQAAKDSELTKNTNTTTTVVTSDGNFPDIKGHWALGSIQKLINKKFIKGYPDGYFKPNQSITRAEFIKILVTALNLKSNTNTPIFNDTKTHWAKNEISAAREAGITDGYKDGNFKPNNNITRAEIVSMINNAKAFPAKTSSIKFSDVKKGHWAEPAIYTAAANGIVSGYKGGLFKPNNNATRAEACSMIDSFLTFFKLY